MIISIISIEDIYARVPEARIMSIIEGLSQHLYTQSQYLLREAENLKQEIEECLGYIPEEIK